MKSPVFGLREILVPTAETTFGETLGYSVPGLSPEEAKKTTPGKTKVGSKTVSLTELLPSDGSNSPVPKLMETSPPPAAATKLAPSCAALKRLTRPLLGASIKKSFAW